MNFSSRTTHLLGECNELTEREIEEFQYEDFYSLIQLTISVEGKFFLKAKLNQLFLKYLTRKEKDNG